MNNKNYEVRIVNGDGVMVAPEFNSLELALYYYTGAIAALKFAGCGNWEIQLFDKIEYGCIISEEGRK